LAQRRSDRRAADPEKIEKEACEPRKRKWNWGKLNWIQAVHPNVLRYMVRLSNVEREREIELV